MKTKKANQIVKVVLLALAILSTALGCERELNEFSELTESAEQTQSLAEAEELGVRLFHSGAVMRRSS